jgi:L,D-transpeptidase catalytic domain
MINYSLRYTLHMFGGLSVLAPFVLVLCVVALLNLPVQTREQQPQQRDAVQSQVMAHEVPAMRSMNVLLKLAETVGQSIPAKRLIEYKLRADPSTNERYWAIVDFNQPSTNKRFYLFDTEQNKVDTYYVAHGRGSGDARDERFATVFSNGPGSNGSSLGIYRALDEYIGNHGRSMRLEGLEPTNSNALARAIVLHKADYVSEDFIRKTGRLGRSEGCFAVESTVGDTLIDKLENGGYIIAWKE